MATVPTYGHLEPLQPETESVGDSSSLEDCIIQ